MADQRTIPVKSIILDLKNYRILPQTNEEDALKAIININTDRFWALVSSLLEDGYHPTDNLLLLKSGKGGKDLIVKEGNRRVAAIKLILGIVPGDGVNTPKNLQASMAAISDEIKGLLQEVPCLVYDASEADLLDKCITRIHGKGDQAARTKWEAVATARHNRDINSADEPGLDLLERYLKAGKNMQTHQRERWGGDYPLTILNEALQKLAPRIGLKNAREVVDKYPKGTNRPHLEELLLAIGEESFSTRQLRVDTDDQFVKFGFIINGGTPAGPSPGSSGALQPGNGGNGKSKKPGTSPGGVGPGSTGGSPAPQPAAPKKPSAKAHNNPASVIAALKKFAPKGANRGKVVVLRDEAVRLKLDLDGQPHAFCFLLRSMFEISAKAYCDDHPKSGLTYIDKSGTRERDLASILTDVTDHMTNGASGKKDPIVLKRLKGALTDLKNPDGILSVNSMNQLVHNPNFSVDGQHIAIVFHNIFPLLEALNE